MEYRRGRIMQAYRRWGRPARLARFRLARFRAGATHVTHDDDNFSCRYFHKRGIRIVRGSMRWTNSWGRMLRWGRDMPSFTHAPFLCFVERPGATHIPVTGCRRNLKLHKRPTFRVARNTGAIRFTHCLGSVNTTRLIASNCDLGLLVRLSRYQLMHPAVCHNSVR
jgi:hypothetical protein